MLLAVLVPVFGEVVAGILKRSLIMWIYMPDLKNCPAVPRGGEPESEGSILLSVHETLSSLKQAQATATKLNDTAQNRAKREPWPGREKTVPALGS